MLQRLSLLIGGAVQGVGFRPFVYRLATELSLAGWVSNGTEGVRIEVDGERDSLDLFVARLRAEAPPLANVRSITVDKLRPAGYVRFEIRRSEARGSRTTQMLPDAATCPDCLSEILDGSDRRHRYPFINCTRCGPRFTLIEALPYDRPNTTMRRFPLCGPCRAEYVDPADRRFHAQPTACLDCGPRLQLWTASGATIARDDEALRRTAAALRDGQVVAVKGLGGFHLMAAAGRASAVMRIREGKPRRDKPLALMVRDISQARHLCRVSSEAAAALASPAAPIVLMPRSPSEYWLGPSGCGATRPERILGRAPRALAAPVADCVAPGMPDLGLMLPATPLHHLLVREVGLPLVATSGNLSDETICTDERDALGRLGHIADLFLVHDRPIARHADDSLVWILRGRPRLLRRARGFAPAPVLLSRPAPTILAVGGQMKSTVALSVGDQVIVSQHVGDLDTPESRAAFERVIADLLRLYEARPVAIAHDLHPGYASTRWAELAVSGRLAGADLIGVQHHHAHLAACLADNGREGPALGVTWDGTGYGTDGTVWGGEFLLGGERDFTRFAHFLTFRLPGGEAAVREPRRVALSLLWEVLGPAALDRADLAPIHAFAPGELRVTEAMLSTGLNSPMASSAGRLFDGVASLAGLGQRSTFEGQAALALEHAAEDQVSDAYPIGLPAGGCEAGTPIVLDWRPMVLSVLEDLGRKVGPGVIAARFHNALAQVVATVARQCGRERVALTGGCFQNRLLVERTAGLLEREGFEVLLHRQVPPGDGGISLGQVAVAAARLRSGAPKEVELSCTS